MAAEMIETGRGVGALRGGELHLRDLSYRLVRRTGGGVSSGGTERLEGYVEIEGLAEAAVLAGVDDLLLELQDGRLVPITLTSSAGHFLERVTGVER